jgi:hypothetical protein
VCTASDQCHDAGTCDTTTGVGSNPEWADPNAFPQARLEARASSWLIFQPKRPLREGLSGKYSARHIFLLTGV